MKFRTEIEVVPFGEKIDHTAHGFSIGSCFAESIAEKLRRYKFPLESNPFGVLYNPFSIAAALEALSAGKVWAIEDLRSAGGLYFSYDHHGCFSGPSPDETLAKINSAASRAAEFLTKADYVIITFGTAWVYEFGGRVVANCHKQPASAFHRRRLTVNQIVSRFSGLFDRVLKGKQIIFTVSPVRHLKDGFEENSLSKAVLRLAIAQMVGRYGNAQYFPAYEILNDDLRDYRFYADDLVHPSAAAVEYVWEKFSGAAFSCQTRKLLPRIENIVKGTRHRPFNRDTEEYRKFRDTMLRQAEKLRTEYPHMDLGAEIEFFGRGR